MLIIQESDKNAPNLACDFLAAGKIISFATDTVYGLAVNAANYKAVENLYKIKNRNPQKPIAIFVKDLAAAQKIFYFEELAKKVAVKFLPGSLTMVLKLKQESSALLAANLNYKNNQESDKFLGFRIIESRFVSNLLQKFEGIMAVTSANKSNEKAAISAKEVEEYFRNCGPDSGPGLLIDGGISGQKIPSAVVKIFDDKLTILRSGSLNSQLAECFAQFLRI
jgi:L-threonylcarbamoyladenylate synthase